MPDTNIMTSTKPWKPCPRCFTQMPGERDICEACEAKEKGLPPPKREEPRFTSRPLNELAMMGEVNPVESSEDVEDPLTLVQTFREPVAAVKPAPPVFSKLAVFSLFFSLFLGPIGLLMSAYALRGIYAAPERFKGKGVAWLALILGVVWTLAAGMALYLYLVQRLQGGGMA